MGFDREETEKRKCGVLIKQERENVELIHCSKITISEEHWEGKFSAPASTAYVTEYVLPFPLGGE